MAEANRRVGILGLSFKPTTDDLRESPVVQIVETLLGKGFDVRIYDPIVGLSALIGSNRDYLLTHLPHVSALLVDSLEELVNHADTLVIGSAQAAFKPVLTLRSPDQVLIDLVGLVPLEEKPSNYRGICW